MRLLLGLLLFGAVLAGLVVLLYRYVVGARMIKAHFAQQFGDAAEFKARLRSPEIARIEALYHIQLPPQIAMLYGSYTTSSTPVPITFYVRDEEYVLHTLYPFDVRTLEWSELETGADTLAFASDDFGNLFFLKLNAPPTTGFPVYFRGESGEESETVAESFEEFYRLLRANWPTREEAEND